MSQEEELDKVDKVSNLNWAVFIFFMIEIALVLCILLASLKDKCNANTEQWLENFCDVDEFRNFMSLVNKGSG